MGLCKSLLEDYAQKLSLPLPSYCCKRLGKIHFPTFICNVEFFGVQYTCGVAHSRKEAEIQAVRTTLLALQAWAYELQKIQSYFCYLNCGFCMLL